MTNLPTAHAGDLADVGSFRLAVHPTRSGGTNYPRAGIPRPDPAAVSWIGSSVIRELSFGYGWNPDTERPADTKVSIDLEGICTDFLVNGDGVEAPGQSRDAEWDDFLASLAIAERFSHRFPTCQNQPVIRRPDDSEPAGALGSGDPIAAARLGLGMQLQAELSDVLSRIAYLGPIRARPERSSSLSTTAYHFVGPEGSTRLRCSPTTRLLLI